MVREIIRRARACRWKPHAALFKLNPVRIIIGGQLGPSRLIPRDRICEYEEEKRRVVEGEGGRGKKEREREREQIKEKRTKGGRREKGDVGGGGDSGRRNGRERRR